MHKYLIVYGTCIVEDDSASGPRGRDVTKHLIELQSKFSRAENYLDNLPGGYLSSSAQLQEQDRLEKILQKKTKFLESCLEVFKKTHQNKKIKTDAEKS
mmetsp:Transcript_22900/g.28062  ORF Transcript_22900/g.28062 Transcript_22900/m.28062 type:complete len:99 (-) Transcript_22900:1027-1323(-)